ncbi:LSU ribosomal protein L9P [Desulfuromusa kysingii]|uniref:Large ribosomal subunit protein bL9 n=1 Tax=Desulfuromusa kysingii TaxID=37625 RepID=A0A1H3ZEV0_9BACT|nr:50S ribosomal protein L9 [Desulfuromusa kysingii]SEA21941.1 LSU ribosomal protein L9P [Desulfuromusa kysingii]
MNNNIILKENIDGLGIIGDVVSVKAGYARNYLIPKGLASAANEKNVKELDHQKRQLARKLEKATKDAEGIKARIEKVSCEFTQRASEEGKLFGSVTSMDLEAKLKDAGVDIDRKKIQLGEAIKSLGEHIVSVKLDVGVVAELKVTVIAEEEA